MDLKTTALPWWCHSVRGVNTRVQMSASPSAAVSSPADALPKRKKKSDRRQCNISLFHMLRDTSKKLERPQLKSVWFGSL